MTNGIQINDEEVIVALSNLSNNKMNKAYKDAMKKSLDPIVKQTKSNLRKSGIKNVNKKYIGRNGKEYGSMLSGIKTSIDVRDNDEPYGKVHIMGDFRLKWFEKGTALRKTGKGYNRGVINPKWFFRNAVNEKGRMAQDSLEDNIRTSIIKQWERK